MAVAGAVVVSRGRTVPTPPTGPSPVVVGPVVRARRPAAAVPQARTCQAASKGSGRTPQAVAGDRVARRVAAVSQATCRRATALSGPARQPADAGAAVAPRAAAASQARTRAAPELGGPRPLALVAGPVVQAGTCLAARRRLVAGPVDRVCRRVTVLVGLARPSRSVVVVAPVDRVCRQVTALVSPARPRRSVVVAGLPALVTVPVPRGQAARSRSAVVGGPVVQARRAALVTCSPVTVSPGPRSMVSHGRAARRRPVATTPRPRGRSVARAAGSAVVRPARSRPLGGGQRLRRRRTRPPVHAAGTAPRPTSPGRRRVVSRARTAPGGPAGTVRRTTKRSTPPAT
ncbi:hypothetical protein SAMN05421684_4813 [Asanoa ishikariensis]|uniref:Uncharacterized protein n=1 Tax=Asanoa ishikariensis TaxID=137265 RepID=A0A1H3SD15_9ACTN|nr:hypothetical protein SAMN05421684_4813 [Asanoa ishikariensis]